MSTKYLILRRPAEEDNTFGRSRAGKRGPRAAAAGRSAAPKVEVGEMQPQRAANLARSRDVISVAPVLPMRLIAPVASARASAPTANGVTWGVQAVAAVSSPFDGEGIVVAVIDTGIDPSHPAFAGVEIIQKNFTSGGHDDEEGHGTHCAGTIFGRNVGGTRIGVAPGVRKALIGKVFGPGGGGSDKIVEAIQWAVKEGANVISMSLGIDFPGFVKELEEDGLPTEQATSMALEGYRANILLFERLASFIEAQNAFIQTALLIAAAGNESQRDATPPFEIAVSPPAVADGFVSVAGVANTPQGFVVAPFSNFGARVAAPGVDIESANLGGGLTSLSGTSMATPHVAGVAALWAQKLRQSGALNGKLLADRLVGTANTAGMKAGFDPEDVGAGLVQAPES